MWNPVQGAEISIAIDSDRNVLSMVSATCQWLGWNRDRYNYTIASWDGDGFGLEL